MFHVEQIGTTIIFNKEEKLNAGTHNVARGGGKTITNQKQERVK